MTTKDTFEQVAFDVGDGHLTHLRVISSVTTLQLDGEPLKVSCKVSWRACPSFTVLP